MEKVGNNSANKEKYYISTAITYTSGKPHIGNTYEIVLADAIARYKRKEGYDVYFQTGTDEHGEKIEQKAKEANLLPQQYVDEIAGEIKRIWDLMNTSYDSFVRTTNQDHKKVVGQIFQKLYDQGDIYKGFYEGWYCTPCESFFTESQLNDGKCPDCGREVKKAKEEAYFFRMSKYQNRLEKYINEHPDFIEPVARKNEMINNFIKPGLQDLCVSRTSFNWGVPVPFDSKHVVYVWIDALTNYITFLGYNPFEQSEKFKHYWPADLHLIGKDILRFHTIYWPILLMALDLELPKQIFGHPWLLMGNDKMSKSKGNVLYADDLVEKFGVDAVRYYLLHEIPFAQDGNITYELLIERINSDLANILGNLVQRTLSMAKKYFLGHIEFKNQNDIIDQSLRSSLNNMKQKIKLHMDKLEVADSIDIIFECLRLSNKYIDETMPWVLAKEKEKYDRLQTVIYHLLESIRICAAQLAPFLPNTSEKIFDQLNLNDHSEFFQENNVYEVKDPEILFKRIDKERFFNDNNL